MICLRCGKDTEDAKKCDCMDTCVRQEENQEKEEIETLYQSDIWMFMSESIFYRSGGYDEYLLYTKGIRIPGTVIHHIYPACQYPSMRLLPTNLICLSENTHKYVHYVYSCGIEDMHDITKTMFRITLKLDRKCVEWYYKLLSHEGTKGNRVSKKEQLKIAKYCIDNKLDYHKTAEKFQVSYQQVYRWVREMR